MSLITSEVNIFPFLTTKCISLTIWSCDMETGQAGWPFYEMPLGAVWGNDWKQGGCCWNGPGERQQAGSPWGVEEPEGQGVGRSRQLSQPNLVTDE